MVKLTCCWLYAISKYGYPPSIANTYQALREMKALGFRYVELEGLKPENMREVYQARTTLKAFLDDLGLQVVNFCPVLPDSVSPDQARRNAAMDLMEMGVEVADLLGADTLQADSFVPALRFRGESPYASGMKYDVQYQVEVDPRFDWGAQWEALVDCFSRSADLAAKAGLTLLVEPRVGELISNTDAFLRLHEHVGRPNFAMVLDCAHQHAQKEILPLSVEKLGKKVAYVHVADNDTRTNVHLAPGEGTIDWRGVFEALKKHSFSGNVGVDVGHVPDLDPAYRFTRQFLTTLCEETGIAYAV